jgi:hypothetical protein
MVYPSLLTFHRANIKFHLLFLNIEINAKHQYHDNPGAGQEGLHSSSLARRCPPRVQDLSERVGRRQPAALAMQLHRQRQVHPHQVLSVLDRQEVGRSPHPRSDTQSTRPQLRNLPLTLSILLRNHHQVRQLPSLQEKTNGAQVHGGRNYPLYTH